MSPSLVTVTPSVMPLPKLTAPTATDLAAKISPHPAALDLAKPGMSSSEYIHALEQKQMSSDAIKGLTHGMPDRESVWYATQSSKRVEHLMTPADKSAMQAAGDWAKDPSPANHAKAAAAAAATDHSGPGAWAAQGAAWSPATPGVTAPAGLTSHATSGSVHLAAAMEAKGGTLERPALPQAPKAPELPTVPKVEAPKLAAPKLAAPQLAPPPPPASPDPKVAEIHQPYVALGKDVAAGRNTWA